MQFPNTCMPVQRLKLTTLPLDLLCSETATHLEEILTTGKSHEKKPDGFSFNDDTVVKKRPVTYF
jgi:hypothetical protein